MTHSHVGAPRTPGRGWLTFAAVMFLVAATFNAAYGIAALANDDYFAADELLFGDLSMWAVIYLVAAGAQALAGGMIFARRPGGIYLGVFIAMMSALIALLSIGADPVWSVTLMAIDGLIIYGLTVYGPDATS